jgi:hypothetical protein
MKKAMKPFKTAAKFKYLDITVTNKTEIIPSSLKPQSSLLCSQELTVYPILDQTNPIHTGEISVLKIKLNRIHPSRPRSYKWYFF